MIILRDYPGPLTAERLDRLADELGSSSQTHVILLDERGAVWGDSRLALNELGQAPPMTLAALERRQRADVDLEPQDELELVMAIPRQDWSGYLYMTLPLRERRGDLAREAADALETEVLSHLCC